MAKRVRITNDSINSYGTRVLTAGMDTTQYERNPVLLYMHERGNVIGYVKDLKREDEGITCELVFDEATELSRQCKYQWEFGSLKMVSVGIDILEMSDKETDLIEGQSRPTITKSKLFEVSLVDIGANDDAIVLKKDGKTLALGKDGKCELPLLTRNISTLKTDKDMDMKELALKLGLKEDATHEATLAKIDELLSQQKLVEELQKENDTLKAARIEQLVDTAISEKRIEAAGKEQFMKLGKKIGAEELTGVLKAMNPRVKLSAVIGHHGGAATGEATKEWKKLSDVPESEMLALRENDPGKYAALYKAEYGIEPDID